MQAIVATFRAPSPHGCGLAFLLTINLKRVALHVPKPVRSRMPKLESMRSIGPHSGQIAMRSSHCSCAILTGEVGCPRKAQDDKLGEVAMNAFYKQARSNNSHNKVGVYTFTPIGDSW